MCSGAGPVRARRLTEGMQFWPIALASSRMRGITCCSAGSSRTARAVCPVSRHRIDIDILVRSFDQMVSRICAGGADAIDAPSRAALSLAMRSLARSSHSPIRSMLRSGVRLTTTPGSITSFAEKITPPMMRSFGTAARNAPPGSRKERSGGAGCAAGSPMSYHQGMPFWAKMTGVSAPSSGFRPLARLATPVAFKVEITTSCGPSAAGSSEAFTLAANLASPTRRVRPPALTAAR